MNAGNHPPDLKSHLCPLRNHQIDVVLTRHNIEEVGLFLKNRTDVFFDQTISQPFIVALMVQALELKGHEQVLELGTGSGYEAAILAELAQKVVTVECIPELAEAARRVLDRLGYSNIEVHIAAKTLGWPDGAPYDAIIVSAGAPTVPQVLVDQLAWDGRLVLGKVWSRWKYPSGRKG
jgi:protein-L-isoaspartate(D-aspartate) O-methyltransferase